jgi:hypothetical protein
MARKPVVINGVVLTPGEADDNESVDSTRPEGFEQ